ncbi:unnamed protein product [Heterobilharzia americana]|nr:unnamed protein product [Heterobilharzia americana]
MDDHQISSRGFQSRCVCFSRHDLSAHNAATHKQDPRPYRCEQCGRQFSTCAYLSQHRRIHTGVKPYACRYCDRRFTQLSHVQQHERIHTGEKPYRCTTCMKSFTQMSNLQSHQRQHMKGKPYRCEQCFMSFDTKEELDVHVQAKHSGNRYAKVLVCPICTKSYNSETYLAKHVDRHKEAAATAGIDGNGSNANNNNSGNNSSNNMRNPTCVDNLFAAGFHNHSVAMAAAAASALSRGNVMEHGSHITGGARHPHGTGGGIGGIHSHNPHPAAASAAAAAAVAAAHAHQDLHLRAVAAAAVASSNGVGVDVGNRGDIEDPCAFFNSATSETRGTSPNGCDLLPNNALNYSSMSSAGLFHHLPVGIHAPNAENLAAAVQQQCVTSHRHQQAANNARLSHFQEDNQHVSPFGHSNMNNMSPNHHAQSQQQQQPQYNHHHQPAQHIHSNQRTVHSSSKRQSNMKTSSTNTTAHSPTSNNHRYSESPATNDSQTQQPQQQQQQHLLNLTQHRMTNSKRLCSPVIESSATNSSTISPLDRYISTPTTSTTPTTTMSTSVDGSINTGDNNNNSGNTSVQQQHSHIHSMHRAHSNSSGGSSNDSMPNQHSIGENMPQLPPPAHQHCRQTNHLTESNPLFMNSNTTTTTTTNANNNNSNNNNEELSETSSSTTTNNNHQQKQQQHMSLSKMNSNQTFTYSHMNNFSSSPTSPRLLTSTGLITSSDTLLTTTATVTTAPIASMFRQSMKTSQDNYEKWPNNRNSIDIVNSYANGLDKHRNEENRGIVNKSEISDNADIDSIANNHHLSNNDTNKDDINTPNHMYDFLFHGNLNSDVNEQGEQEIIKPIQDNGDDDKDHLSDNETSCILNYRNNTDEVKQGIIDSQTTSFGQDGMNSSSLSPISQKIISSNGSLHGRTPLSSSSTSSPYVNYTHPIDDRCGVSDSINTATPTSTSIGIESILNSHQSSCITAEVGGHYDPDTLKSTNVEHLFSNNVESHDLTALNNTITVSEKLGMSNDDGYSVALMNRTLKRSFSNRELYNLNEHDGFQNNRNKDHAEVQEDEDYSNHKSVKVDTGNKENNMINSFAKCDKEKSCSFNKINQLTDGYIDIGDGQEQQHAHNLNSAPLTFQKHSETMNSSKRRRRHQYVPQHLPIFEGNMKDIIDRRKNNSYSTTDYFMNRRGKTCDNILDNSEEKCLRNGKFDGESDSFSPVSQDDNIIASNGIEKKDTTTTNNRECYFSAF